MKTIIALFLFMLLVVWVVKFDLLIFKIIAVASIIFLILVLVYME